MKTLIIVGVTLGLIWRGYQRAGAASTSYRLFCVAVPVALVLASLEVLMVCMTMPDSEWSGVRLAASLSWRYGYSFYASLTDGPVGSTIYPPLMALVYWPTVWCSDPYTAVMFGCLLSACVSVIPGCFLIHRSGGFKVRGKIYAAAGIAIWLLVTCSVISMKNAMLVVHADGPAIGACICAAGVHTIWSRSRPRFAASVCGALAGVATAAKQLGVFIVPALVFLLMINRCRWRTVPIFFLAFAVTCVAVVGSLLAAGAFTWSEFWFNVITLPNRHGYYPGFLRGTVLAFSLVISQCQTPFFLLVMLTMYARSGSIKRALFRQFCDLRRGGNAVFWCCGVSLIPAGLLGMTKVGGWYNNLAYPHVFLVLAMVLEAVTAARRTGDGPRARLGRTILGAGICVILLQVPGSLYGFYGSLFPIRQRMNLAFAFAKAHPGEVYFPNNPIFTLLSEGRLYHQAYAVFDRGLAGLVMKRETFRKYIPPKMKWMIMRQPYFPELHTVSLYLPEFRHREAAFALSDWAVWGKEPPAGGTRRQGPEYDPWTGGDATAPLRENGWF